MKAHKTGADLPQMSHVSKIVERVRAHIAQPEVAGFTIGCRDPDRLKDFGVKEIGGRHVVPPEANFGTAIAFAKATQ